MQFNQFIRSGSKLLRCGYTTGTCAALATAGAAQLLLTGKKPSSLTLLTPKGIRVQVEPDVCRMEGRTSVCAVRKDAGDDPDVTDGLLIFSTARKTAYGIRIEGGEGVGRVTKKGLDQPVGAAAINSVPRRMILSAVAAVCEEAGYAGGLEIIISVPGGEETAKKTFNPMLGIEGGISILGTSGIVEPMSEQAIVSTIELEIRQASENGAREIIAAPGNYALDFLRERFPIPSDIPVVKCSNYLGDTLDIALSLKFRSLLFVGHIGKLVKLAGGIMNTHSRMADCRRELLCAHAALCGADQEVCRALMNQPTTDGCLSVLTGANLRDAVLDSLLQAIQFHLDRRVGGEMQAGAVIFSNEAGFLGMTEGAQQQLASWNNL